VPYTAAQLTAYYTAVNFGQAPDADTLAQINLRAQQNAAGQLSDQQTLAIALQNGQVRATTDVAVSIYQYFSGSAPSQAGMNFLLNTPGTGLNTSYYNGATGTATNPSPGGFNLENRYYNLAVSQAFQGTNAAAFAATYTPLTLQQTVAAAYEQIVGAAVVGTPQANAAIAAIQGSIPFFQQVAGERAKEFNQDLATKAIIVGYILEESIKAGVGAYSLAIDQHNAAIAAGNAVFNANILTTYAPGAASYGIGVGAGILPINLPGSGIAQQRLNLPSGQQVNVLGALTGGLTLQVRDASGPSDTLSITVSNGNAAGAANTAGIVINPLTLGGTVTAGLVETLNVTSTGVITSSAIGSHNIVTLNAATAPNTVNIGGPAPVALVTGAATHGMTINAGAATGSVVVRADAIVAAGAATNITGGAANDTLGAGQSSTAVAQSITGGGGGDLIFLGGGTLGTFADEITGVSATHKPINTIVYKAATDSLFDAEGEAGSSRSGAPYTGKTDIISGFVSGQDKIDVKALGFTQAQLTVADKGNVADLAAFNALVASGNFYKDNNGVLRGVSELHNNGDVYLAFDVNHNGVFDANADLAIRLLGIANVLPADLVGT